MLSSTTAVAVGAQGLVIRTTDGGESWKTITSRVDNWLVAVDFANERNGLAVGYSTILATEDGGITWTRRSIPPGVGDCALRDVTYSNESAVVIVGTPGVILASSDQGRNWVPRPSGTAQNLMSIAWSDPQHATAVGDKGIILNSADGGLTWTSIPSGTDQNLTGVGYLNSGEGFAAGEFGILLHTSNNGKTWVPELSHTMNHLRSLSCRAGNAGFTAGWNGTILRREADPSGQNRRG
jgi:photosystem II stability/assembly factor-like uncharacterized protein